MKKQTLILFVFTCFSTAAVFAQQPQFSISTDIGIQRSFKKQQRFGAVGQSVYGNFHFAPKGGAYFLFAYYTPGNFTNPLTAIARSTATVPQQINFINTAQMRFKQLSVGWKKYIKGAYNSEESWNLYGLAGFGLVLGSVENAHSVSVDTALYNVPVIKGKANFKRLTADLGLGWEAHLGGGIYFYNEAKAWIPTTDYPSKYIFVNENAPLVGSLSIGIRILFD